MTKANYFNENGEKVKQVNLPKQFNEEIRPDLIKRAALAIMENRRQPYGAFEFAGRRASAEISKRRRKYRGCYGHGISRVQRKILWRRGTQMGWVGAFAPGTVKGRKAHPPKPGKVLKEKVNKAERKKAICSALSATVMPELVKSHGHKFKELPTIIDSKIEELAKTKQVRELLIKLGLEQELQRTAQKKIRAGRGKSRARKYRKKTGPLIVISKKCSLIKAAANIQGVDVCLVNNLNAGLLAPGAIPGRLAIYTEDAIKRMEKEKLFL